MANILVAEDDSLTRLLLQHSLELDGHNVTTVRNGREAIEFVLSHHPQLILLDLMMPGMNGGEVILRLREELGYDKLKILVVTGTAEPLKVAGVSEADEVLSKPIPIEELLSTIRRFVE
jgi:CheY-like chemotaxis protein